MSYSWSVIREEAGALFYAEYDYNEGKRVMKKLKQQAGGLQKEKDDRKTELNKCKLDMKQLKEQDGGLQKEKEDKKTELARLRSKKKRVKKLYSKLETEISVKDEEIAEQKARNVRLKKSKEALKFSVQHMLSNVQQRKWVVFMGVDDVGALRMLRDVGGELTFTLGKSVPERIGVLMKKRLLKICNGEIKKINCMGLYKLHEGHFTELSQGKKKKLGFNPRPVKNE